MTVRPWGLAVDFGTTATAAVTVTGDHVSLLSLDGGGRMSSSVYATGSDGALLVGKQADNQAAYALDRYESTPKRLIHRPSARLGGRQFKPVELIAAIMAHVLSEALGQHNGSAPAWLVLTHPVSWSSSQRQVLADAMLAAARQMEVPVPDPVFVAEPVAAAQWYYHGTHHDPPEIGQKFAVYDLGGGTFDVAVLERTEQGYSVIHSGGIDPLGGYDFDHRLFTYLGNKYIAKEDADLWRALQRPETGDVDMGERRRQMRTNVQYLKEQLSTKPSLETHLRGVAEPVLVTKEDFETLIVADVDRTIDEFLTTLDECDLSPSDLAIIYRVGGASRIPLVGQKLEALGAPVYSEDDPKLVVAKGAAVTPEVRFEVPPPPPPRPSIPSTPEVPQQPPSETKPVPDPAVESVQPPRPDSVHSVVGQAKVGVGLGRWSWRSVVTGTALLAFAVGACVLPWRAFEMPIARLWVITVVSVVVGAMLIRIGSLVRSRARRGYILVGVTLVVVAVTAALFRILSAEVIDTIGEFGVAEVVLGILSLVGTLLVVVPQWRRNPGRGAVAGLVVGGLIVAAAEAMAVIAVKEQYGFHRWVALDTIAIATAVVLFSSGVLAGRRRKGLRAAYSRDLSHDEG